MRMVASVCGPGFLLWALAASAGAADKTPAPAATMTAAATASAALQWRLVGPFRGGRTRAVAGVPGRPGTFLIGAVNGGVWETRDFGRIWTPIFDAQPTQSIGAIAVAPANPDIIYVGSGEGLNRPDLSVGDGVYRSADGGRSWSHRGLDDARQIADLAIDPRDADRVYVAVKGHPYAAGENRGIYRTTDGGQSWTRVLYRDADTGGYSVKVDPFDPDTVYATLWNTRLGPWEDNNEYHGTGGGMFKSTDGGEHWRQLKTGLPDNAAQIDVAVAPSQRGRLYATVGTTAPGDYSSSAGLGLYRSDDGGESWRKATSDPRPALRIGGGDLAIVKVDPRNADVLYSASLVAVKSTDGGVTWSSWRGAPGGDDYQNLWISPDDSRQIALVADQGAVITVNGGASWSSWFNQPTAQLYHVGVTAGFPYRICSGQQESGSVCIASRGNDGEITAADWHPVGVIEYGYVAPDPLDPDVVYGAGRNVVTRTQLSTGQVQNISPLPLRGPEVRVDRTEPIFFSPQDPHRMYYAANRLYVTTNGGQAWQAISPDLCRADPGVPPGVGTLYSAKAAKQRGAIYAVSASPLTKGLLWAGTDDGLIWRTRNDGGDWQDVTPPPLTGWSKVTQLEASHFDADTAYASVSRFRVDDLKPYIYRTRDGGHSWQPITSGLPDDAPVNTVREDPVRRGLLYAGTEKAVWVSFDDGGQWQPLQLNLPHTSMRDLVVHGQDLILATHGRSFWILDDLSPLRQFDATMLAQPAALLKPAPAVRVRRSTWTDSPIQPDEPTARNPPDGAVIDYYLGQAAKDGVVLELLDAQGAVVRRYTSNDPPPLSAEELARELIPAYWIRPARAPSAAAGMHRWVWDLAYPSPRVAKHGFPISAVPGDTPLAPGGAAVPPGDYRVRLSAGGRHWEQPLTVTADPRVHIAAADYAAQLELALRLGAALDASTAALLEVRSLQAQLDTLALPAGNALADQAQALRKVFAELLSPPDAADGRAGAAGVEAVNDDLSTLYEQVVGADVAPTQAQRAAADATLAQWQPLTVRWQGTKTGAVSELNRALRRAHREALRPELAPPHQAELADQE